MRKLFQWFVEFLDAIVGVSEDKSNNCYISVYEAREKYEAGLISMHEYNETLKRKDLI
ncbi:MULTISPECIES: hypothetical protein [Legionella]|uniref:Uncharacterized protein n=1 Tax=Legionella resiliens TaxID=2905958 RepID=A0ABS8X0X2_9GAMM|nr:MULTISPECIES: hypothetical protein [unclassified Legionella]MCE0723230.1 hypothetical protein [Legionella sp. 9fVS26]MCE3532383.1 hypothetical protein [Legionella sp. 8cVS16]QLZ68523.1 hypothetical protein FOLKNPGA_01302 [Legionella sp. PC1000]